MTFVLQLHAETDQKLLLKYISGELLSDLAVLSIENHRAKQLDTSGIVDAFAQGERHENGSLTLTSA